MVSFGMVSVGAIDVGSMKINFDRVSSFFLIGNISTLLNS